MLDPAAKVLHYSQEIFEGLKAYARSDGNPCLFRPQDNARRLNLSAERMCMPEIPLAIFMEGVERLTALAQPYIPVSSGGALYLRPFMIGVDAALMMGASRRHEFYVIASPSMAYHEGRMRVMVERQACRAALGGTGAVKVGGNYAAALHSSERAKRLDFDQTLWLDPEHRRYIEELSGMNLFALIDGELHTPALSGSILPGITRDSLICLARQFGYTVRERRLAIEELLAAVADGRCTEFFACGTAAVVTPISVLGHPDGERLALPEAAPVAERLRGALVDIQEGRRQDQFAWVHPLPHEVFLPELQAGQEPALSGRSQFS